MNKWQKKLWWLTIAICAIAEPMINQNHLSASAQNSVMTKQLNNFLNQSVFAEDPITRYAAAVNAIESKRLEIFRLAKNHPNWGSVANLAESKQTKVCDLTNPPEFLQDLCNQLRTFTEEEIQRRRFTNKEFNQITRDQRQDAKLRSLIQAKQMQLRGNK